MTWEEINAIKAKTKEERTPQENKIANLIPIQEQIKGKTREELLEAKRRGGRASGEKKHKKKMLKDITNELLNSDFSAMAENDEKLSEMLRLLGNEKPTGGDLMMLSALLKGIKGDTEAMRFVRDTSGQKPTEIASLAISRADLDGVDLRTVSTEELLQIASDSENDVTST